MDTEQKITENSIIATIQEKLNEEKWTRATIENYSQKNFTELDEYINKAFDEEIVEDLYDVCVEHLKHSQQSIIALYIIGMISLKKDAFDLSALYKVINQFREYKKYTIVEYLSEKILEHGDDKYILNTLKDVYELTDKADELHKIWERIIKIDYDNGEIARKLGDLKLEEDNEEDAVYYYKTALKRFARQHNMNITRELWETLLDYIPLDLDFFYLVEKEIAQYDETEAAELLKLNVPFALDEGKVDKAIEILIKALRYNSKDKEARNKLAESFRIKYKDHSQLDECLKSSSLNQTWKNFEAALDDFQRRIAFDENNYVYHRSWGIGRIKELNETHMIIDFDNKKDHKMSLKMALNSLKVLPKDHIWIQKKNNLDELRDNSDEGIEKTLKILLKSMDNKASRKEVKSELVPDVISTKEWTKWWNKAKKVMKKSAVITQSPTKKDEYILRENPLTFEEETLKNFHSVATFDEKFNIFIDYIETSQDESSEVLIEMIEYFTEICNKSDNIDDRVIKSYLLLKKIRRETSFSVDIQLNPSIFNELDIHNIESIFNKLKNPDFKRSYLMQIKKRKNDWEPVFKHLILHTNVSKSHDLMLEELIDSDKIDILKEITNELFSNQRQNLEGYIWCVKKIFSNDKLKKIVELEDETIILNLIRLLDILNKEIENKKKVTLNKKMHSQIVDLITKDDRIEKLIDKMEQEKRKEDCRKLTALLRGTISLSEKTKGGVINYIYEKYPEFLEEYEEKKTQETDAFFVTKEAYDRKRKEYENLVNIEIPHNSKDIGKAQEKGDLRENAEYQMALERQKQLQAAAAKLNDELNKAKILDFNKIDTTMVGIGTKVTVLNLNTKKQETYSILGEWDSNIDKNIISYMSPLGKTLLGAKRTETRVFSNEDNERKYKILKITKANN